MHGQLPRSTLERYSRTLKEMTRRRARADQAKDGWYDFDPEGNPIRRGGLIAFVRYFWHVLEPETPFVDGWPLWAMCEHLEAVTRGEIRRLLMNVSPGSMKSLLVDVFWPAWEWGPRGRPSLRYVSFSYASSLTERDNGRFSDLINSPEYQELYRGTVNVVRRGDTKVSNTRKGWKIASSVGGVGTGERGDRVILDDPHNVKEQESEAVRSETVRWFRESMSNRLNDLDTGAIIVIMQRVHEDDVSGVILSLGLSYCHLMIPMEYDVSRQIRDGEPVTTSIGWYDPRFHVEQEGDKDWPNCLDGVLAWPQRFSPGALVQTRQEVGPYAWASQYQQSPAPRGGAIFQEKWWQVWESPDGKFPLLDFVIASLDGAFTEKEENNPSALTVWGVFRENRATAGQQIVFSRFDGRQEVIQREDNMLGRKRVILIDAWRKHLKFSGPRMERLPHEVVIEGMDPIERKLRNQLYRRRTMESWGLLEWVVETCRIRKVDVLLIEAKANGISAAQELRNRFTRENWAIELIPVKGDKVARANAAVPTFSNMQVYAPVREWADMVIQEMAVFPKGKYDDLTDSTTQAINYLRNRNLLQDDETQVEEQRERVRHRPQLRPLYPC